jgi:hypothetical protein
MLITISRHTASCQPVMYMYIYIFEIGGQTLRAYSTCCKDERKSYKYGSGIASFTSYMYGRTNGNCRKAQRFYQEIFLQRRCPSKKTFSSVHHRLRETGSFLPNTVNRGRNRNIRTPAND